MIKNAAQEYQAQFLSRISKLEKQVLKIGRSRESLEKRYQFEKVLSGISCIFTNLPTPEIDRKINYGLQQIGKILKFDRFNLLQFSGAEDDIRIHHSWENKGIPAVPKLTVSLTTLFPWLIGHMKRGKIASYARIEDLPAEASIDKKTFKTLGIKSFLSIPISVGGSIVGALTAVALQTNRIWPEDLVHQLSRAGEVFANAVARKEKDQHTECF